MCQDWFEQLLLVLGQPVERMCLFSLLLLCCFSLLVKKFSEESWDSASSNHSFSKLHAQLMIKLFFLCSNLELRLRILSLRDVNQDYIETARLDVLSSFCVLVIQVCEPLPLETYVCLFELFSLFLECALVNSLASVRFAPLAWDAELKEGWFVVSTHQSIESLSEELADFLRFLLVVDNCSHKQVV